MGASGRNTRQSLRGLFADRLGRARKGIAESLQSIGVLEVSPRDWQRVEEALVGTDIGPALAEEIVDSLRSRVKMTSQLVPALRQLLIDAFDHKRTAGELFAETPLVVVLVGVNGSGKTTTAAKLAGSLRHMGRTPFLVAADTYRAGAQEQLAAWADRMSLPIHTQESGADPAAVAFDGVSAAFARRHDVAVVDTAGRLHTNTPLMAEAEKVVRAVRKAAPAATIVSIIVIDGVIGTNSVRQAEEFNRAMKIDGAIVTKLDVSPRAGAAIALERRLGIPVIMVGMGEEEDDLVEMDPVAYVDGLLEGLSGGEPPSGEHA